METVVLCPNCNEPLKTGFFGANNPLDGNQIAIVNYSSSQHYKGLCSKCGDAKFTEANKKIGQEINEGNKRLRELAAHIPIVTTHQPYNWEYGIIGIVTAQTTTGTGVLSEISSSFTDTFGMQSSRYNNKLRNGELLCYEQLRVQTMALGGNAIIATDIDYAEVGGDKGMLMVCMSGTAVILNNMEVLAKNTVDSINELAVLSKRISMISRPFYGFNR